MGDAPASRPLAVESQICEYVEPTRDGVGVAEEPAGLELRLADQRLRVDDEPRLARSAQHVSAVEVLIHEKCRRAVDRSVDVERDIEQRALERLTPGRVPARHVLSPAVRLVGEEDEEMLATDVELEARQQLCGDDGLVEPSVPEPRSRHAALEEESPAEVVASDEPNSASAAPCLERVGLVIGLDVRQGVQLENDVTGGDHQRVRGRDRLLEIERPLLRALGDQARQRFEPVGLVAPRLDEGARETHRRQRTAGRRIRAVEARFLERALELAAHGRGTTHPNPIVGAVVVAGDEIVGEGWHERRGEDHAEIRALAAAGERAAGATIYVTLEPCAHHGTTRPCVDALVAAGVVRVVVGQEDPNPNVEGGGVGRLREAGVEVEVAQGEQAFRCRRQLEAWRTWVTKRRPFVTYKVAVTLDGRVTVPGARWVSGEEARRLVHELRAAADAVAVGMGTVRWDDPRLDARGVPTPRGQPRRLAFGRGPLPEGSELELREGPLLEELEALAADGVQSLLLEGGPTLAAAFLEQGLVDKVLVFVAPTLAGEGAGMLAGLVEPVQLTRLTAAPIGDDVLLSAYVHEP